MRVIVVGRGIGGLSAAIALCRAGHEVVALEPSRQLDPVGAGITLLANAMDALARLGVAGAVAGADAEVQFGHGELRNSVSFDWQENYINTFVDAVSAADWGDSETAKATVVKRMMDYLPASDLQFLMELSIEPVAIQLGLISATN